MYSKASDQVEYQWLKKRPSRMRKNVFHTVGTMSGFLLILTNALYMLMGVSAILLGVYGEMVHNFIDLLVYAEIFVGIIRSNITKHKFNIVIGIFMLFLAGTGIMGVQFNYKWLLIVRSILIMILYHLHIFVVFFINVSEVHIVKFGKILNDTFQDIYSNNMTEKDIKGIANLQQIFHCCGYNDAQDYIKNNITIPLSCFYDIPDALIYFRNGCYNFLYYQVLLPQRIISIFSLFLLIIQTLLVMAGTTILLKEIHEGKVIKED